MDIEDLDIINPSLSYSSNISTKVNLITNNLSIWDILPGSKRSNNKYIDCPFCNKRNKLSVLNSGKAVRCFYTGCPSKKKGDGFLNIITVYQLLNNKGFQESVDILLSLIKEKKGYEIDVVDQVSSRDKFLNSVLSIYKDCLWNDNAGKEGLIYLRDRGISERVIQMTELGYAPSISVLRYRGIDPRKLIEHGLLSNKGKEYFYNSIIVPVRDYYGKLIHLQGRYIRKIPKDKDGEPLYLRYKSTKNYKETQSIAQSMFGEERLSMYSLRSSSSIYITEGIFDALSLLELGLPAVSMFGINSLKHQIPKLKRFKEITIIGDNDKFDNDHILYPGQYKSWSRLNNQVYDLQISLPKTRVKVWKPEPIVLDKEVKDVNDYLLASKEKLRDSLKENSEEFINYWKKHSIDKDEVVDSFIKLVCSVEIKEIKERGKDIIRTYIIKRNLDPVDFVLKAISDNL